MIILIDKEIAYPAASVWGALGIEGRTWKHVLKNLIKNDLSNAKFIRNEFDTTDTIILISSTSNPRYGLYLYISDVMKEKEIIFIHFIDQFTDLPDLSFLKNKNIIFQTESRVHLIENLFSISNDDLTDLFTRIFHEDTSVWYGGVGTFTTQHGLGDAIFSGNKLLKLPRNIQIFLFGQPTEELIIPLCEHGLATVQRMPTDLDRIIVLQEL